MQTIDKMILIATKGNIPVLVSHYLIGGNCPTLPGMDELCLLTQNIIKPNTPNEAIVILSTNQFLGLKDLFVKHPFVSEMSDKHCTFETVAKMEAGYISAYLGGITFHFTQYNNVITFLKRKT